MDSKVFILWLVFAAIVFIMVVPTLKILKRMGYSGWWSLSVLFPPFMFVMIWVLAFRNWPIQSLQSKTNLLVGEYMPAKNSTSKLSWQESLGSGLGCLMMIAFLGYGIVVLAVGWIGIEEELGWWWAFGASALAIVLRFTLPIAVGAIFGAMHLWDLHWTLATLFALPGLAFMIPALLGVLIAGLGKR